MHLIYIIRAVRCNASVTPGNSMGIRASCGSAQHMHCHSLHAGQRQCRCVQCNQSKSPSCRDCGTGRFSLALANDRLH